jgi:hypothetical protein
MPALKTDAAMAHDQCFTATRIIMRNFHLPFPVLIWLRAGSRNGNLVSTNYI